MGRANRALAEHGQGHRAELSRRPLKAEAFSRQESALVGNPVRDQRVVARACAVPAARQRRARSASWCSAAARARASSPTSCRRPSPSCRPSSASRLRITQQCRPEDLDRVAEIYRQAKVQRRAQRLLRRPAGAHGAEPPGRSRGPALRPSPSSPPSAGRRSYVPLPGVDRCRPEEQRAGRGGRRRRLDRRAGHAFAAIARHSLGAHVLGDPGRAARAAAAAKSLGRSRTPSQSSPTWRERLAGRGKTP